MNLTGCIGGIASFRTEHEKMGHPFIRERIERVKNLCNKPLVRGRGGFGEPLFEPLDCAEVVVAGVGWVDE